MAESDQPIQSPTVLPNRAPDLRTREGLWLLVKLLALLYALIFYIGSAHLTQGHYKDFITHWTMAALAARGHGTDIYNVQLQSELLHESLPPDKLDFLTSSHIQGIGVSPYPPVMVLLYLPLGFLSPAAAQWCMVQLSVVLAIVSAWAISRAVEGRISFTLALLAILYYPGFFYMIGLGQNAILTLALWSLGWLALCRRRDVAGGAVWGVLAYKVHWVAAVGWLPAVLGRPRAYGGLAGSVALLVAAATLVFGPGVWHAWFVQVQSITDAYGDPAFQADILGKACDLRGVAYRYLPATWARPAGWVLLAGVGAMTLGNYWLLWKKAPAGSLTPASPAAASLLLAAGLISPYLMYYDVTVLLLPLLVLWSHRASMTLVQRAALAAVTMAYFLCLPIMDNWPERWQGPPLATGVTVALWMLSLWVARISPRLAAGDGPVPLATQTIHQPTS